MEERGADDDGQTWGRPPPPTPQYQSSRNVERAGKTWNALLNLRSDVMCEVEG